jgi:iron(III) transport system ATP-binding protein
MAGGARVRLEGVSKRFGATVAVDGVSLTVEPGEFVTLLGPSGCGKTTTLRIVAGLEEPTTGRVWIGDEDVTDRPTHLRDVTMVFQSYALFPHLRVFDNVAYGLRTIRRPEAEVRRAVTETLALVGMEALVERYPAALSGGQQQRVALARALVLQPKVLLFDEPLSNLDAKLRKRMRDEIRALQRRTGITALYVTHDQTEALAVSDRIAVMAGGRVEQVGRAAEVYARPATRFVADFIGEASFLAVEVIEAVAGRSRVRLGDAVLEVEGRMASPGPALLVVRPEAVRIQPAGSVSMATGDAPARAESGPGAAGSSGRGAAEADVPVTLPGTVVQAAYLGAAAEYLVETAVGRLGVLDPVMADGVLEVGAQVGVTLAPRRLALLPGEGGP